MANQMIALQARNPQLPDPQQRTARLANMMNATRQAEAAQLQGERTRQEMAYAEAGENRAAETQKLNARKEDQAYRVAGMAELRNRGVGVLQSGSEEAYQLWLKQADVVDPDSAAIARKIAPTLGDGKALKFFITKADEYVKNNTSQRKNEIIYDKNNNPISVDSGGDTPFEATPLIVTNIRDVNQPPRATPTAPQAAAPAPASVGEFGEAKFVNPESIPLTPYQQEHIREMQNGLGMSQPASFSPNANAGQMTPDVMSQIVNSAFETGVMAQVDFDQLLASQAPQNKQALMDSFRRANITLQADAPSLAESAMSQEQPMAVNPVQTPQSRTANLGGDMPMMRQTQAQYRVGDPIQGRIASPAPGIYSVPTSQVAEKARAERETPGEVYAKEKARARAQREALLEAGPKPLTAPQEAKLRASITKDYKAARSTLDMMLNPVAGVVAAVDKVRKLSPTQKEAITGYSGYLPTMYAGTKSADTVVKNLKGKVTEMGKSVASLTGAIGQMAVQEWRIVSDMIASLDLEGMNATDLDNQLDIIEAQARRAAEVTRDAYENQYVEEFDRYPGRFRLPDASAMAAPAGKRRTPTKVDQNNPLLKSLLGAKR